MRFGAAIYAVVLAAGLACGLLGCGAPIDPTPNRAPSSAGSYPAGPYGYASGSVIANLGFIGKSAPAATDYTPLPMQALGLGDLRANGTKLILIEGAARWCVYCNQDQPAMKQLEATYGPRGVVTLEVLAEGTYGVTATEDDINRWTARNMLSGTIVIDPERQLDKYADVNAYPLYMIVRASDMQIEYMATGGMSAAPVGPVLDMLLAQ